MALGKFRNKGKSGNGGFGSQNAVIELDSVQAQDKKGNPNWEGDYAVGLLLHDAFGLKAEFDVDGNPTTEIRFKIRKPENINPDNPPPSIARLNVNDGLWRKCPEGSHLVLERAYMDERSNTVMAGWLTAAAREPYAGEGTVRINDTAAEVRSSTPFMVSVGHEGSRDMPDGEKKAYQRRMALYQENAVGFNGVDEFKAKAVELLTAMGDEAYAGRDAEGDDFYKTNGDGRGTPFLILRGAEKFEEDGKEGLTTAVGFVNVGWLKDGQRLQTPQEAVDAFVGNEKNAQLLDALANPEDGAGTYFDLIPAQEYITGRKSLPSQKKGKDDARMFDSPILDEFGEPARDDEGNLRMGRGYAPGIMMLGRQDADARWFCKGTFRTHPYGPISPLGEIVTPGLPADLKDAFESRAQKRIDARKAKKPAPVADEPEVPAADPTEDMEFGAKPVGM